MSKHSIETEIVRAGERSEPPKGRSVAQTLYPTVTYSYDSMLELDAALSGEGGDYVYSRYGNPSVSALETAIATLENGAFATAFASGMAAIHAALAACDVTNGSIVLASQDLYGATFELLDKIFDVYGVRTVKADFNDLNELAKLTAKLKPKVLIAETISNPLLKVCDIEKVAEIARQNSAKLIIDNTFASPYLCQPLNLGADFSVHSATKYLGGHGDATGGIVVAKDENDLPKLDAIKKLVGGILSPWEAHQILRGVKTLALRIERQCENAEKIAQALLKNKLIANVYYPNLDDKKLANKVLRGHFGGALVSIKLKSDTRQDAWNFMDSLSLCVRATSLGDVFTLVSHSASSSHRGLSPKERARLGIAESLVRISVGIENADDIIADIEQALIQNGKR